MSWGTQWRQGAAPAALLWADCDSQSQAPSTVDYFHSIGTEALGTLAAWTQDNGAWAILNNVVSPPAINGARMHAGHPDWTDFTATIAITNSVSSAAGILGRANEAAAAGYLVDLSGPSLRVFVRTAADTYTLLNQVVVAGWVAGTQYWLQMVCSGTLITGNLFADNAGVPGVLLATVAASDATFQSGYWGLRTDWSSGAVATYGITGKAHVCVVSGPAPGGMTTNVNTSWGACGEPSFAWSSAQSYNAGGRSLSIKRGTAPAAEPYWGIVGAKAAIGASYRCWAQIMVPGGDGVGGAYAGIGAAFNFHSGSTVTSATWGPCYQEAAAIAANPVTFALAVKPNGVIDRVYFDEAVILPRSTWPVGWGPAWGKNEAAA